MSGIYVTAESWLNNASTNETRGKVLSAYMIAQTLGIIGAQGLLTLGEPATSALFIGASILVSISFAPILLSARADRRSRSRARCPCASSSRFTARHRWDLPAGRVYATQSGMGAGYGTQVGMTADSDLTVRCDAVRGRTGA